MPAPPMHHLIHTDLLCVDAHYIAPNIACLYLLKQGDRVAIIETGVQSSQPHIQKALAYWGKDFSHVDYIIPTHVHLDHAGGASALLAQCHQAQLVIHPRGARHMVNPSKLVQGAQAVYGKERFAALYGDITPIEESRILIAEEGFALDFGGRKLLFLDTPGHARHHFCVWDEQNKGLFTGDAMGLSYRLLDGDEGKPYLFATTTPTQFDPEAMLATIDKLLAYQPQLLYLTHFSAIPCRQQTIAHLKESIHAFVDIARKKQKTSKDSTALQESIQRAILEYVANKMPSVGVQKAAIDHLRRTGDAKLNAQGLVHWLQTT